MTDAATSRATASQHPPRTRLARACEIAFTAQPFRADTTQLCAGFTTPGHATRAVAIRSREFIEWIRDTFAHQHGEIPSVYTLREARNAFEARAWFGDGPKVNVARRVLGYGRQVCGELEPETVVVDLTRPAGRVIEITAEGWRVAAGEGHCFYKHPAALPLPRPKRDIDPAAALDTLRRLLGVRSEIHWRRVLIWLVNAIRPAGPYPILAFHGPDNSGKTRAVRLLRHLIDPVSTPLTPTSRANRQIEAAAWTSHVLALETIRRFTPRLGFVLTGISTSTGHTLTEPHSGRDPVGVNLHRPILLSFHRDEPVTLRNPLVRDEEFASHVLAVALEPGDQPPCDDPPAEFEAELAAIRPTILALLCDAASRALANEIPADLRSVPRLARESIWPAIAAPLFNLTTGDIVSALHPDTESAALAAFLTEFLPCNAEWTGTLSDLRQHLPAHLDPGSEQALSHSLRRATHHLKRNHITAEFRRAYPNRTVTLTRPHDTSGP
jgi:hypothetical protein